MSELSLLVLSSDEDREKFHFAVFSHEIQSLQASLLGALGLPESGRPAAVIPLPSSGMSASLAGLSSAQQKLAPMDNLG